MLAPIAASAAAIVFVGQSIDWKQVVADALTAPLWAVLSGVFLVLAMLAMAGFRLSTLSIALGAPMSWRAAASVWSVAHLAGLLLPTSVGSEVVKGGFLLRIAPQPVRVLGILAIERIVTTLALVLLVLVTVPIAASRLGHDMAPLLVLLSLAAGVALFLVSMFRGAFFQLARRLAKLFRMPVERIDALGGALAAIPFTKSVLVSLAIHLLTVLLIAVLLAAFGVQSPFAVALLGGPLVIFVSLLPISVGGFGLREGAFVLVFGLFGTAAGVAASVGLAWWGVQILAGVAGSVLAGVQLVHSGRRRADPIGTLKRDAAPSQ